MKKLILVLVFLASFAPLDAQANSTIRDRIVRELQQDGYSEIRIFRTFLGRLRFVAQDGTSKREIVVNPATGVILRDYLSVVSTPNGSSTGSGSNSGSTGSGGSGGSDEGGDDDDDDDNDDSGSGSSGSGSGSGSSGSGGGDDGDDGGSDSGDDSGDDD